MVSHLNFFFILFLVTMPFKSMFGFTLIERIKDTSSPGDCIILEQGSTIYALKILNEPTSFFIAKAPDTLLKRTSYSNWIDWLKNGAEGALETVTTNSTNLNSHFPELFLVLTLPWEKMPPELRKKRGPDPLSGEIDFRPDWNPKIVVDAVPIKECISTAFDTHWPKDGSEVAGKRLVAYFPNSDKTISWFPYWIEFPGLKSALFVIDSKKGLPINKQSDFEEKLDKALSRRDKLMNAKPLLITTYKFQQNSIFHNLNNQTLTMHLFSTGFTQKEGKMYA